MIAHCLEFDPADRPKSADAVEKELPTPMAAAIAAGQTPSPAAVRDEPVSGSGLSPRVGLALLGAVAGGLVVFLLLYNLVMLVGRVGLPEPTNAGRAKARDVMKLTGQEGHFDSPPASTTIRISCTGWKRTTPPPRRWDRLNQRPAAAIYFWFRQSPKYLVPPLFYPYAGSIEVSRITLDDPPRTVPGMARSRWTCMADCWSSWASRRSRTAPRRKPPNWKEWFAAAELDQSRFKPVGNPRHVPLVFADARYAWEGTLADQPDEMIRVEACTHRGRVVSFRVVAPWTDFDAEDGVPEDNWGSGLSGSAVSQFHLFVLVLVAMFVLAPTASARTGPTARGVSPGRLGLRPSDGGLVVRDAPRPRPCRTAAVGDGVLAFAVYWAALDRLLVPDPGAVRPPLVAGRKR